jgi:uncharacterized OsmC-like protein
MTTQQLTSVNGFDLNQTQQLVDAIAENATNGIVKFQVHSTWTGGPSSSTQVTSWELGDQRFARNFTIQADEPQELGGSNSAPNPQELFMAGCNACFIATYAALCALQGIKLEKLEVETKGQLDLRGFFQMDESVKPGYEEMGYTLRVKGDATLEQFNAIHQMMMTISPNFWNLANPIQIKPELCVE